MTTNVKTTRRILVVLDAEFGLDPRNPYDTDENAYVAAFDDVPGPNNITHAINDGKIQPGTKVYVEFATGDVVNGTLTTAPSMTDERQWQVEITHNATGHKSFAPTFACYSEERARAAAAPYLGDSRYTVVIRSRPVGLWTEERTEALEVAA